MADERLNSPEQGEKNNEALERANAERSAELKAELERKVNETERTDAEKSLAEAKEAAAKAEKKVDKVEVAHAEKRRDTPAQRKAKAKASYKATMKETQAQMSAPSRAFSKVIHNKAVEKTSEVVGGTVARPNAILAGSLTAFLFTLAIYVVAKYLGYPLSGTETIASFVIGWMIGLLFDYLRVMITGKKA